MGLTIDELYQTVERAGESRLTLSSEIEWHIFHAAYRAGEDGASKEAVLNGYPGDKEGKGLDNAKGRLKNKLQTIGLSLANGSGAKLIEWDGK